MTNALRTALTEARRSGWAAGRAPLDELTREGQWHLQWAIHATRGHVGGVVELRPVTTTQAHPASLSSTYGTGAQPLHTDDAHQLNPARWLLLVSTDASAVPTMFWHCDFNQMESHIADALREGLFTVVSGRTSFLAPARSASMLRFDPACMRPSDGRALVAADYLSSRRSAAQVHAWKEPHNFLLLDNHRMLHGRADASGEPDRILHRITFDLPSKAAR